MNALTVGTWIIVYLFAVLALGLTGAIIGCLYALYKDILKGK